MKKKWIILIVVILLLTVVGGVFWWERNQREEKGKLVQIKEAVKYPTAEEWVIKNTPGRKIVENEKAGLKIKVPEGWRAEKTEIGRNEWSVSLSSPDSKLSENNLYPVAGCGVSVVVEYSQDDYEMEKTYLEGYQANPSFYRKKGIEVIKIDEHLASKRVLGENPKIGKYVSIRLPFEHKVYVFSTVLVPTEKDRCSQEFDKFLEGVSIK